MYNHLAIKRSLHKTSQGNLGVVNPKCFVKELELLPPCHIFSECVITNSPRSEFGIYCIARSVAFTAERLRSPAKETTDQNKSFQTIRQIILRIRNICYPHWIHACLTLMARDCT